MHPALWAALALLIGWLAACSTDDSGSTPSDAGLDGLVVTGSGETGADCAALCGRVSTCTGDASEQAACSTQCQSEVSAAGDIGRTVLQQCTACVTPATCADLTAGSCDSACPVGDLDFDGGGNSTGDGERCTQTWQQDGRGWEAQCERSSPTDSYYCDCFEEGVFADSFESSDFCGVDVAARTDRAVRGCSWVLGDGCGQWWYFESFQDDFADYRQMSVTCEPNLGNSIITFTCSCVIDEQGVGQFESANFCVSETEAKTEAVVDMCDFPLGEDCAQSWMQDQVTYRVDCTARLRDEDGSGREGVLSVQQQDCRCSRDDVDGNTFLLGNYCGLSAADQTAAANQFCGWTLSQ